MQFVPQFPEAVVEKYNELAAQRVGTAQAAETKMAADVADRTSATGSVSVAVGTGTGIQNANNLGSASAGEEWTGGSGCGEGVPAAFGNARMKPLTAEQAMQVKRALIGRRLHFYDRMRGHKEPSSGGSGLKLVKSITDFAHSRRHGSSHQLDKGLLLLIIDYVAYCLVLRFPGMYSCRFASLECLLHNKYCINSINTLHVCYVLKTNGSKYSCCCRCTHNQNVLVVFLDITSLRFSSLLNSIFPLAGHRLRAQPLMASAHCCITCLILTNVCATRFSCMYFALTSNNCSLVRS